MKAIEHVLQEILLQKLEDKEKCYETLCSTHGMSLSPPTLSRRGTCTSPVEQGPISITSQIEKGLTKTPLLQEELQAVNSYWGKGRACGIVAVSCSCPRK